MRLKMKTISFIAIMILSACSAENSAEDLYQMGDYLENCKQGYVDPESRWSCKFQGVTEGESLCMYPNETTEGKIYICECGEIKPVRGCHICLDDG
jgi:hypothetical protein